MTLNRRYFNVWLELDQAGRLERIAAEKGKDVGDVVQEIVSHVLAGNGEGNQGGRFILLRVPELTYRQHLKFFDGNADLAKQSMVASVEASGQDFAQAMRTAEGR